MIVGMDDPLVGGLVDELEAAGIRSFGPRKNAAILEGSKAFFKDLMKKYNIQQLHMRILRIRKKALAYLEGNQIPHCPEGGRTGAGKGRAYLQHPGRGQKGVRRLCWIRNLALQAIEMVIEEFMTGREVSVLSFVDGNTIKTMTSAQDHKRAGDGDTGA